MFNMLDAPRIYGRVFTAWGSAGVLGPLIAGSLFDWTGSYQMALFVAGALAMVSVLAVAALMRREAACQGG
jgi:OFA family oxalate/formate antiporter-like MFS transporter